MSLLLRDGFFLLLADNKRAIAEDVWDCRTSAIFHAASVLCRYFDSLGSCCREQ